MYEFLFHRGPFSLQGKMKEVKPKNSHSISNNKAQFTRQIDTRPRLKIRSVKNVVSRSILGPGFLVNRVEHSHQKIPGSILPQGLSNKVCLTTYDAVSRARDINSVTRDVRNCDAYNFLVSLRRPNTDFSFSTSQNQV